ncbi:GNAT family N-acetyltransferase [Martelella soudanensis]|uniref:GNAT family N-acetyltransferase n=1 Tax=unclassified Martelella TaxID=2629616 RepID=UPI0015DDE939|nr:MULTISPECIES: GNAT family N-acetyltransferase [unclassified Martelella]
MRPVDLALVETTLPDGFERLRKEASREGFRHMERLASEWNEDFRYDRKGECLMAAWSEGRLQAIGGVSLDPVVADATRMRRFYVHPASRRHGVGRALASLLVAHASVSSRFIFVNAGTELAAAFWEAVGFARQNENGHSHVMTCKVQPVECGRELS